MTERKQRAIISKQIIRMVESQINSNQSLKNIATNLNLSYATVKRIASSLHTDPGFVDEFKSVTEKRTASPLRGLHHAVSGIIDSQNNITISEIKSELSAMNINVSDSTISRAIKKIGYSRKRLSLIPIERNTPAIIEKRTLFARHIAAIRDEQLLFLDECGFSRHTMRHYGYSLRNQKAVQNVRGSRGNNQSLICIISHNDCIANQIFDGSVNGERLRNFLEESLPQHIPGQLRKTLVLDNAKIHHTQGVREICQRKGINIQYLPAYSPQLNPIEEFFSVVKANYKRSRRQFNTTQEIHQEIVVSVFAVEYQTYQNIFRNMRRWIGVAMAGEPFI